MCVSNSVVWIGTKWRRNYQISWPSCMRASQWRFIIRHCSPPNGSPRTSPIQSLCHTLITTSWLRSPRDVLSVVTKLHTNLPRHVERCILFWWSMVSTVRVCKQSRPPPPVIWRHWKRILCVRYTRFHEQCWRTLQEMLWGCEQVFRQWEDNSNIYCKINTHFSLYSSVLILYINFFWLWVVFYLDHAVFD